MTWDEIAKIIAQMSPAERAETVLYREPYDKEAEIFSVDVHEAVEDLADPEGEIKIKKGEFFLQ